MFLYVSVVCLCLEPCGYAKCCVLLCLYFCVLVSDIIGDHTMFVYSSIGLVIDLICCE